MSAMATSGLTHCNMIGEMLTEDCLAAAPPKFNQVFGTGAAATFLRLPSYKQASFISAVRSDRPLELRAAE
jgi:hypothetical protein